MVIPTAFATSGPKLPSETPLFPKAQGYNALVGDQWVRTAPNQQQPIRLYTKDSLAQRQDRRGSVYENVLDLGYAWARGDLSGGEGLDYDPRLISQLDDSEARDVIRFFDSNNMDIRRPVRGESFRLKLSSRWDEWTQRTNVIDLATSDLYIYVAVGDTVYWYADWDALSEVGSHTFSDTIVQMACSPADELAVVLANGNIEIREPDGTVTTVLIAKDDPSDPDTPFDDAKGVWWVKGRFVAAKEIGDSGQLFEVTPSGAAGSPFDTYTGECHSVVDSGPAVVAAFSDGTVRSYVPEQSNQLDAGSVNLVIRGRTQVPEGEIPVLLGSNSGILLIQTRASTSTDESATRIYQAEVLDARFDYVVGQLQMRREWLVTYEEVDVRQNMAITRDEIWFAVDEVDAETAIWRFDVVTAGLSRHVTLAEPNGLSIIVHDEEGGIVSEGTVFRTGDVYVDEGWLIGPNITFGLNTPINWMSVILQAQDLTSGGKQVELWYSHDPRAILDEAHTTWTLGIRLSSEQNDSVEKFLSQVQSNQLALMIRLFSSENGTNTPNVSNFAVRGFPSHRDWILELPVNVSDYIEVPNRYPQFIQGYGELVHTSMMSLVGDSLEIIVLDPSFAFRGIIDNVIEPTVYVSDRGSASVRCILQCRGERITSTSLPTGDAGLGLGLLGVEYLGIGQTEQT